MHLSTFNFRRHFPALLACLTIILITELILGICLPNIFFSNEGDEMVFNIKTKTHNADYVVMGDSIGRQILEHYKGSPQVAMLATNIAVEMPGQYFLLKRYLAKNKPPKAVYFVSLNPLGHNLDFPGTENYIQRVFVDWSEIFDMAKYKNVKFTLVNSAYKLFASFRYRLNLQRWFTGFSNAHVYDGQAPSEFERLTDETKKVIQQMYAYNGGETIGKVYFLKYLDLLHQNDIEFHFINPPMTQGNYLNTDIRRSYKFMESEFLNIQKMYPKFHYESRIPVYIDELFMNDHYHLTNQGVEQAVIDLKSVLPQI